MAGKKRGRIFVFTKTQTFTKLITMSNSNRLSETLVGNIKNQESQKQDVKLQDVLESVLFFLMKKYPKLQFGIDKKYPLQVLEKMVSSGLITTQEKTYIKPDGGLLYMLFEGKKYYILVSEQKRQGTNDKRREKNLKDQGNGNAVERLGKNVIACEILFGDEDITPLVVFLQGCDFCEEESTIPDRVKTIAKFQQLNQINLFKKQLKKYVWAAGSFFMRGHSKNQKPGTSDWTFDEMYRNIMNITEQSINYYLSKYGEGKVS